MKQSRFLVLPTVEESSLYCWCDGECTCQTGSGNNCTGEGCTCYSCPTCNGQCPSQCPTQCTPWSGCTGVCYALIVEGPRPSGGSPGHAGAATQLA
jgi:hypothetical protein